MQEVKVTYDGVDIIYSEDKNRWQFELRGRERFSESLAKAKEAIGKSAKSEANKFSPVAALAVTYSRIRAGTITSICELDNSSQQVWFVEDKDKVRRKEFLLNMFESSEYNLQLVAEIADLDNEAESLQNKAAKKRQALKKLSLVIPE